MNLYGLIDVTAVRLGALFLPKYFRDGVDSPPLSAHLQAVGSDWVFHAAEMEGECEVKMESAVGTLRAAVKTKRWAGEAAPALIYHHGAAEIPYDYGFNRIFPSGDSRCQKISLFALRAPWHASRADFNRGNASLANWMAMLAVSVTLMEKVITGLRAAGVGRIAVSGASLGGFVTNLHHIHCGSAGVYLPLLAGLAMDEAYLDSAYSGAVGPLTEEERRRVRRILNFEDEFRAAGGDAVFPLLARHDALLTYDRQRNSYGDLEVDVLERGHATGAIAFTQLREHIFRYLWE